MGEQPSARKQDGRGAVQSVAPGTAEAVRHYRTARGGKGGARCPGAGYPARERGAQRPSYDDRPGAGRPDPGRWADRARVSRPRRWSPLAAGVIVAGVMGCGADTKASHTAPGASTAVASTVSAKVAQYTPVRLNANLEKLADDDRRMLP